MQHNYTVVQIEDGEEQLLLRPGAADGHYVYM